MKNRIALFCFAASLFLVSSASNALPARHSDDSNSSRMQQPFSSGGTIDMHLESGAYDVIGSDADTIVVTADANNLRALKNVQVRINVAGTDATLLVENTPHDNFHATIQIPRRSNLRLRLTAGALTIDGVEGDKDVESHAGVVEIRIPNPEQYGHRDASVVSGSLEAPAFEVDKAGLFRSFHQDGPGKYRLHVHVGAGEISLTTTL